MELNRILVISKPRCGSTRFASQLAKILKLDYLGEPTKNEFPKIKNDNLVIKVIVGNIDLWESTKERIFKKKWDVVILLRRNEEDSKLSFAHRVDYENKEFIVHDWHSGYRQDPHKPIPEWIDNFYNNGEVIYEEVLGMDINTIVLTYENLFNKDRNVRESEINKVIEGVEVNQLLYKNMLDNKLDPKYKYTNPENWISKSII